MGVRREVQGDVGDTHKSSTMFTEGGLQVGHLLEAVDESRSHLTLEEGVSPEEIRNHLILTDQSVSGRTADRAGVSLVSTQRLLGNIAKLE